MAIKQYKDSTNYAYKAIKQKIINKEIPAGSRLNQQELAEELEISRTPVVKVLHKLETEGLVDNIPNQGFYVHCLTLKELYDLFLLRQALDSLIISDIIDKIDDEKASQLRDIFALFINCHWDEENIQLYRESDKVFHGALLDLCENDLVKKINDHFQIYERTYHGGLVREPWVTLKEHLEIIDVLERHDEEEALKIIHEHTEKSIQLLKSTIKRISRLGYDASKMVINDVAEVIKGKS